MALEAFMADLSPSTAAYMESCIRCGKCAEACEFYLATGQAKYVPIWKVEPFRRHYARTAGSLAWLYRAIGLKQVAQVTLADLVQWQELVFDACTLCGRCTAICPMGIDIAALVERARRGMLRAGLGPTKHAAAGESGAAGDALSAGAHSTGQGIDAP
jgi:Fe-S oxidoreductase